MRCLTFLVAFIFFLPASFSQSCIIAIAPDRVVINDELITFRSVEQFQKLFGSPDSTATGVAFYNHQIELIPLCTRKFKPTGEYAVELIFEKEIYDSLNCFTGTLVLNGEAISNRSVSGQFENMDRWKLWKKKAWDEDNKSYYYYNKLLELVLMFKNDRLVKLTVLATKNYLK